MSPPQPILLPPQPTLSNLEQVFRRITYDTFYKKFQYQFDAQSTTPLLIVPETSVITTFERFYKVEDGDKNIFTPREKSPSQGGNTYLPLPGNHLNNRVGTNSPPFKPIPDDRQRMSFFFSLITSVYGHFTLGCGNLALSTILGDFESQITGLPPWVKG